MSFDLNTRGVKRKLETIESIDGGGVEPLSLDANDARRLKVSPACFQPSTASPYPATALPEIETLMQHHAHHINTALVHEPLVLVGNNNNIANAYKSIANSSLSSDDDNEDDDEEEDDDDEDEENEEEDDEEEEDEDVLLHQTYATNQSATDDSFNASSSMESESGYDERVSNSSNDSTSDCSDYSPPSLMMTTSSTVECCIQPSCVSLPTPPPPPPPSLPPLSSMYTPSSPSASCNTSNNHVASKQPSPSSFYYSHLPYYESNHTSLRSKANYMRQRQQIFNLSMTKLSRFRQSQDPSLYRSVLICNTLRRLEKEFEREGVKINFGPNGVSFISPVASPDLDFLPIAPHSSSSSNTSSVSPPSSPPPTPVPAPSSPAVLTMPVDCSLLPMPSSAHPQASFSSSVTQPQGYSGYQQVQCHPSLASSSSTDYEKYFALENAPPSGRLTPYIKSPYPGEPEPYTATTSRLMEPLATPPTTFWESSDGDALCSSYYQPGGTANLNSPVTPPSSGAMITATTTSSSSCSTSASCPSSAPAPSSSGTPSTPSNTVSSSLNLISSSYSSYLNYTSNADEMFNDIDLSFSTIDIDRYDFDIFSPLSPPTTSTPTTATATSASLAPINPKAMDEEMITRTVNPTVTECNNNNNNNNNGENVVTLTTSTSTTTLLTLNNSYCSNSYSGYNSLSTYATPVLSPVPLSSPAMSNNCAAASSGSSAPGVNFNSSATRFYKPDERDQQKIATIKCHN